MAKLAADKKLVTFLDLKPDLLALHKGGDCVNGQKRKC